MTGTHRPILVVDDDADIRESLVEILTSEGFSTVSAGNGREALQLLRQGSLQPCLILLDLMMPVMDGFQFLEERNKDPSLADTPVVIITAAGVSDRTNPVTLCTPVLPKPIHLPKLLKMVAQLC